MGASCGKTFVWQNDDGSDEVSTVKGETPGIRYGAVTRPTKKDQDRWNYFAPSGKDVATEEPIICAFGVFDGHGCSAAAAELCKRYLLEESFAPQLKKASPEPVPTSGPPEMDSSWTSSFQSYNSSAMDATIHKGLVPTSPELRAMVGDEEAQSEASPHDSAAPETLEISSETNGSVPAEGPSALTQLLESVTSTAEPQAPGEDEPHSSSSSCETTELSRNSEDGEEETAAVLPPSGGRGVSPAGATDPHILLTPVSEPVSGGSDMLPKDAAIVDAFRSVDAQLKVEHHKVRCGTTATSLYVSYDRAKDRWSVKCGWCGDSRAMMIDADGKTNAPLSIDHRIERADELERIEKLTKSDLLPNGTPASYITRRQNSRGEYGPKAVFSGVTGISHLMTRSIGDPHGAPALIPDAEVMLKEDLANGTRLVLASDGLWDVYDEAGVARAVRNISEPARAARKLTLGSVSRRRQHGMSEDDVTVVVVDLSSPFPDSPSSTTSTPSKIKIHGTWSPRK